MYWGLGSNSSFALCVCACVHSLRDLFGRVTDQEQDSDCSGLKACLQVLWHSSLQKVKPHSHLVDCTLDIVTCFEWRECGRSDGLWLQILIPKRHCHFQSAFLGSLLWKKSDIIPWGQSSGLWTGFYWKELNCQSCQWATLETNSPAPVRIHMNVALARILTATSWETLRQNCQAKPLLNFWPTEIVKIINVCFKLLYIGSFVLRQQIINGDFSTANGMML